MEPMPDRRDQPYSYQPQSEVAPRQMKIPLAVPDIREYREPDMELHCPEPRPDYLTSNEDGQPPYEYMP